MCGKSYLPRQKKENNACCSVSCRQKWNGIKGGKAMALKTRGTGVGYVKQDGRHQHRVVMERIVGRSLLCKEVVHHLNGIKSDNRLENLTAMPRKHHNPMLVAKPYQERIRHLEEKLNELPKGDLEKETWGNP